MIYNHEIHLVLIYIKKKNMIEYIQGVPKNKFFQKHSVFFLGHPEYIDRGYRN